MREQTPWIVPETEDTPEIIKGQGAIYSYSIVYVTPTDFEEFRPYIVALVKLDEGPLVTAQITDFRPMEITENIIGMRVEMVTRVLNRHGERGVIHYGYKFRPLLNGADGMNVTE